VAGLPLEISLTAVIEQVGQGVSYWALAHTGAEPDFHRRDSFRLGLLNHVPYVPHRGDAAL
jgi:hypothetical protein